MVNIKDAIMKKVIFLISIISVFAFSSCQLAFFLEPGYWQQLAERSKNAGKKVDSMPDFSNHSWTEITTEQAEELWASAAYRSNFKTCPEKINIYQNPMGTYVKYTDINVDKFPNWIYSKDIADSIYVYAIESGIYDENTYALNEYIPSNFPDEAVIYKASDSSAYVKVVYPFSSSDESKAQYCKMIFRNGLLVQREKYMKTSFEY